MDWSTCYASKHLEFTPQARKMNKQPIPPNFQVWKMKLVHTYD
jgi:hypothetical protein